MESGSIALKICRIADGSADLFVKDVAVRDWDVAAPSLVLTEAGGTFTGMDGAPWHFGGNWEKRGLIAASGKDGWAAAREELRRMEQEICQ